MRVAIDARSMQARPPGGIGRSLANLLPRLVPHADLVLLVDRRGEPVATEVPQVPLRTPLAAVSATWLQISAAWWLRTFDGVFHCPFYGLPFAAPGPAVVTLHDLTFEHFPHWYTRRQGVSFRVQARHAARVAGCILAPSEFVRSDIVRTYDVEAGRVLVAPQGVDPAFHPGADATGLLRRLGVTGPYVVALGGARRRNLDLAVQAWAQATEDHDLVVVGTERPARSGPRVHWAGPVDDEGWAGLLAGTEAFLYPTAYEGFGMPALEALGAGAPVVAAPTSALPEVLGECAEWSASLDVADLAEALRRVLSDSGRRQALRSAGAQRARRWPGWDASAAAHLQAYRTAAAR